MDSLIPEEEFSQRKGINLAPMVDFLFLILAVFAVLAVTRTALYDSEVNLVQMDGQTPPATLGKTEATTLILSVDDKGAYKWVTEFNELLLDGVTAVKQELLKQEEIGALSRDRSKTKVLLHIDKNAHWESIAKLIFAVKEVGYTISPVYNPE